MNIKKGMFYILAANMVNMVFGLITNFTLPKFLTVDSYAEIKTFQLLVSYAGILHLGFTDGMYLKYGGKNLSQVSKEDYLKNTATLRLFQVIHLLTFIGAGIYLHSTVVLIFAFSILPLNMAIYFKLFYQAVGEFNRYGKILNATAAANFVMNMILLFLVKTNSSLWFLLSYTVVNVFIWIVLEIDAIGVIGAGIRICYLSVKELKTNIKDGFLLMLGNSSSIILTSMDRWFVKLLLGNYEFAQYSFAVSLENFLNVAVTPVTVTLYHFFCHENTRHKINNVKNKVVLFSTAIAAAAFPAKLVMEQFLPEYLPASSVMFLLFASQIFGIIIKSVYVNLYKAHGRQRRYFLKIMLVIGMNILLNTVLYRLLRIQEAFALGTLLSTGIWYFLCICDYPSIALSYQELLYIMIEVTAFLGFGICLPVIHGFLAYLVLTFIMDSIVFTRETAQLIDTAADLFNRSTKRGR